MQRPKRIRTRFFLERASGKLDPNWSQIRQHIRRATGDPNAKLDRSGLQELADELKRDYERIQELANKEVDEVNP